MQLPFLFVQDCLSETSELVLVDELNSFFSRKISYIASVYFSVDFWLQQLHEVGDYVIVFLKPYIIFLKGFALNVH